MTETTTIETEAQLETLLDSNRGLTVTGSLVIKIGIPWRLKVGDISAGGYISAGGDISADGDIRADGYISADGDISAAIIYFLSIYAPRCKKLICNAFVPGAGNNDRAQWAERFGIDTSTGCYETFIARLAAVAASLLEKNCWLPVEVVMLKSVLGHFKAEPSEAEDAA